MDLTCNRSQRFVSSYFNFNETKSMKQIKLLQFKVPTRVLKAFGIWQVQGSSKSYRLFLFILSFWFQFRFAYDHLNGVSRI